MFKIGDKVVMNGNYYVAPQDKDKVFVVASEEMSLTCSGGKVVSLNDVKHKGKPSMLDGKFYNVDGLTKVG